MDSLARNISNQEQAIKVFLRDYSNMPKDGHTIHVILSRACSYYDADRSYIFELNAERTHISNTYEWCRDGISSVSSRLQNISPEDMGVSLVEYDAKGEFYISSLSESFAPDSRIYQFLNSLGIESTMAVPLIVNGLTVGFIGVDNPCRNSSHFLLLSVIASACCNEISNKRMEKTNAELKALLETEKQHTAIINSLSNVFFALYYIDVEQNVLQEIFSPDGIKHTYGEKHNAKSRLKAVTDCWVSDIFRPAMSIFTDIDTVNERLGENRIITQEYIATDGNWIRCSLFPAEKNSSGKITKVIFGFRGISDEKERLESKDNLIRALSISYENVFAINMDTAKGVCYRMGKTIKSRYGQKFAVGDYEPNIQLYVRNDVLPEDRHLFNRISTIQNIRMLFAEKQNHSFSYRVFRNDRVQYFECQIVKPDSNRNEFALGFKNIDNERQRELEQQKMLENALLAVEKINKTLQDETEIAGALSSDYPDVVLLDFVNDTAVTIKRKGHIIAEENRVVRRSYNDTWEYYISKYVLEEDRESVRAAVLIENVRSALEKSDEYACSYRILADSTGIHYYQASFIRFYSRHKTKSQIILGFRCVDAIVEEEHKNRTIQEEQFRIIGALSQEYHSLFKIDAASGKLSLYRTDGIGIETALLNKLMQYGDYEEVLSKYIDAFIVPEDRERIRTATKLKVLAEKVPDEGLYKLGYRRSMKGSIAYFEMNTVKIVDDTGLVTYIMGLRDVDDEMQRKLKQAKVIETQNEIIEGLGAEFVSILLVNPEMDTVAFYRISNKYTAVTKELLHNNHNCWSKVMKCYAFENVSDRSRDEYLEKLSVEYILSRDKDYSVNVEVLIDNELHNIQLRVAYVYKKDGSRVVVIGTRDVDDLIQKERQQEMALQAAYDAADAANKAKTEFLSNMSHDIRTPMNGIIGMTAIAATHLDDKERVHDSLQKISQASKHMLCIINEVLDMSKIESGKVDLIEEEFNLSNLIDNLLSMTNEQINKHKHELSVSISGVIHEDVVGDSLRIQKVFTNLMSNGVKYTPDGGRIRLSITEKPSNNAKVGCYEFVFEDNGIGMSEDFLEKIFDPFARASDSRVNKIQGTGLGMPISRNIVRMMGGDIKVESRLNIGSRFTVTIYLKLQDTVETRHEKFIDLNVLVSDDDKLSLESCCGMLEDLGIKADGVSNGVEAVENVLVRHQMNQDYFACIIDWKMPGMDGIATTRAIRKAVGKDVPIIIISAYDWSDIEQEARTAGANAFISKPLFRSRLEKTFSALVCEEEHNEQVPPLIELSNMELTGKRILLAEDNDLNAEIASEILEMTGVKVERAADGKEAVDMMNACKDGYYDLIFMDIQMPQMNGYDATRAIRAMNRSYCKQIPIVAMTANAFAEDVQAAKTVGMNEHIAKPLDMKALAKALDRWIR